MRIETVCLALLGVQLTRAQQEGPSQADPPAPSSSIYTLLHRVVSPKAQGSAWFPRAKLEIKHYDRSAAPKGDSSLSRGYAHEPQSAPALQAAPTYVHHLENLISQSEWDVLIKENESTDGTLSWYQVTLVEGEPSAAKKPVAGSEGPIAAAKLCQLSTPRAHALTVNLSPTLPPLLSKAESLTLKPYAIKYAVPDLMLDANGCPFASEAGTYAVERAEDSLHVRISTPQKPPVPPLQQPVPVREDGTAEVPPVETSFLRKYWMFVLPIVILLILPSEAVAGGSAEHDSSSESAPNAALAARQIK